MESIPNRYASEAPEPLESVWASDRATPLRPLPPGPGSKPLISFGGYITHGGAGTMTTPLIVGAKLVRPRQQDVLPRARLVDRLARGVPDHPLTLLTAGPGYGKTTLLASFAESYPPGTVWYSLGPEDADFTVFLWHLVAALGGFSRRFGRSLRASLSEGSVSPSTAAGALLNDLSRLKSPVAIVFDDFHVVGHVPAFVEFWTAVLDNLKSPVRFVMASRVSPALPIGKLRARRQLLELGPEDLAFTREELRSLLSSVYERQPSETTLELIAQTTEGWVAAVQLVLAADARGTGLEIPAALRRATSPGSGLHDYLAEEVLNHQPEPLRQAMLRTAIFDELDTDIVGATLGAQDVDDLLRELIARRLLVALESPDGSVFRYHTLLLEFLRRRLKNEVSPTERESLHQRAAVEYTKRGDLVRAAQQLAASGNSVLLAEFLRDNALKLVDQGHYQALLSWFGSLPSDRLDGEPWLRLRLGDVRHYLGDLPGAELEYERAQAHFRQAENVEGEGWATLGLCRIWNLRGQSDQVISEGEAALERARTKDGNAAGSELRVRLLQVLSGARFYKAQYQEALHLLDEMESCSRGDPERQAAVWNNRAVVWASQGNYPAAARAFERGLERPGARRSPRASLHLANLALLLNDMGDTERARTLFGEALELAKRFHNKSQMLTCLIGLARLNYRLRNTEHALEYLHETDTLNADLKLPFIQADALALRARILAEAGQFAAARSCLSQALAVCGASRRDANWLQYRIETAVVELMAGRSKIAYQALAELLPLAMECESMFPRTMLLFHLGEAERRLGISEAEHRLGESFRLARQLGYDAALRVELARNIDPCLLLLEAGVESEYAMRLAAGIGLAIEPAFLPYVGDEALPEVSVRALLALFGEIGGPDSHRALQESAWLHRPELNRPTRNALRHIERRHPELDTTQTATQGLRLKTLGTLKLISSSGEIPHAAWRSQRALSLFVYLAVKGNRGVSKERLIELFWPAGEKRRAIKNFHPTLTYVRQALRDHVRGPVIVAEDGLYRLDPSLKCTLDLREFEAMLTQAKHLKARAERIRALEDAMRLYDGEFLGDRYESWAEDLRAQIALQHEELLVDLASLYFEEKKYSIALHLYSKLLERNPFREEIHCKAMMCHHYAGDRHAVREQFDRLKTLLRDELGVEPLPDTATLYASLMR